MFIAVIYWIVLIALGLKIIGNLVLPYSVLKMAEGEGYSLGLVLLVDLILVALTFVLALRVDRPGWIHEPRHALAMSGGAVLTSYLHYFAVLATAAVLRAFRAKACRTRGGKRTT
jgi:hypothetical protein